MRSAKYNVIIPDDFVALVELVRIHLKQRGFLDPAVQEITEQNIDLVILAIGHALFEGKIEEPYKIIFSDIQAQASNFGMEIEPRETMNKMEDHLAYMKFLRVLIDKSRIDCLDHRNLFDPFMIDYELFLSLGLEFRITNLVFDSVAKFLVEMGKTREEIMMQISAKIKILENEQERFRGEPFVIKQKQRAPCRSRDMKNS